MKVLNLVRRSPPVPLRAAGFRSIGQTVNRYIPEPASGFDFQPFTPGQTQEEYDRREATLPKLAQQRNQCAALQQSMLDAHARWKDFEYGAEGEEAAYNEYYKLADEYDKCQDMIDALTHYMDYGGTAPFAPQWEWPKEIPEPESYEFPPAPKPQPPPEPPPVASVDPRFANTGTVTCPVGSFIDPVTRRCRGSVATGGLPNLPPGGPTMTMTDMATTAPMSVSNAFLQGPFRVTPLFVGSF